MPAYARKRALIQRQKPRIERSRMLGDRVEIPRKYMIRILRTGATGSGLSF
jgi:translation elongation factor EF-4